jgi:uncharacterized protein YegP (UPF0339 family)
MWVVEQPAIQANRLADPILTRVDLAGQPILVEAFQDPRITRGTFRIEEAGHSYRTEDSGIVYVSVPFNEGRELSTLRIRVIDGSKDRAPATDPTAVAALFDNPPQSMPIVGDIDAASLRKHPDWLKIATALRLPAEAGRFEIYIDQEGRYRWRLQSTSGEIVADSSEAYPTREACEAGINWIRSHAASLEVVALDLGGGTGAP